MKKIKYSPNSITKLQNIKKEIINQFGQETARRVIKKITMSIRNLQQYENTGQSVESITGIPCDHRVFYAQHNYIFYRVDNDTIWITDIYNEKEDFMWSLFGIKTTTQETEEYWND